MAAPGGRTKALSDASLERQIRTLQDWPNKANRATREKPAADSYKQHNWPESQVKSIFYRPTRLASHFIHISHCKSHSSRLIPFPLFGRPTILFLFLFLSSLLSPLPFPFPLRIHFGFFSAPNSGSIWLHDAARGMFALHEPYRRSIKIPRRRNSLLPAPSEWRRQDSIESPAALMDRRRLEVSAGGAGLRDGERPNVSATAGRSDRRTDRRTDARAHRRTDARTDRRAPACHSIKSRMTLAYE